MKRTLSTVIDLLPLMFAEPGAPVASGWIQIMKSGTFMFQGKKIEITQSDLNQFAENFHNKVRGVDLAVDLSHKPDDGSVGWFEDVKAEPGRLMAKIRWTDEGKNLVDSGKFRYFSPEWSRTWTDTESGKSFRNVLFGGALTNRPFLKGMDPVGIAMSEDGLSTMMFFSDGSDDDTDDSRQGTDSGGNSPIYDPNGDGDDDSTSDPEKNPDWMKNVADGILPFDVCTGRQQQQLKSRGITKEKADGARSKFLAANPHHKDVKFEDRSTKASQKPNESRVTMSESDFDKFLVVLFAEGDDITNTHKSPPAGKPKDASQYADPDNYKYPIDEEHIKAALGYFNHDGQQKAGGYTDQQWSSIGRKIAAAANKLVGPGHSFKDGKIATDEKAPKQMDDGSGTDDGTNNLNPDDGSSTPGPINDDEAGKFSEHHTNSSKGRGNVPVSDEQYQALLNSHNSLEAKIKRMEMSEKVNGFIKAGKMSPASRENTLDMLIGMSEDQVTKFSEMMDKTPQMFSFSEEGFSGDPGEADGDKLFSELQDQYVREGKSPRIAMSEAYDEVHKRGLKVSGYDD